MYVGEHCGQQQSDTQAVQRKDLFMLDKLIIPTLPTHNFTPSISIHCFTQKCTKAPCGNYILSLVLHLKMKMFYLLYALVLTSPSQLSGA